MTNLKGDKGTHRCAQKWQSPATEGSLTAESNPTVPLIFADRGVRRDDELSGLEGGSSRAEVHHRPGWRREDVRPAHRMRAGQGAHRHPAEADFVDISQEAAISKFRPIQRKPIV